MRINRSFTKDCAMSRLNKYPTIKAGLKEKVDQLKSMVVSYN